MALHKEPYGLVYNDDGSLCVTIREDDVPFAGVKSFAVEEGTENLFTNPQFLNNGENWFALGSATCISTSEYAILSKDAAKYDGFYQNFPSLTEGDTYTWSALVKYVSGSQNFGGHIGPADTTKQFKIRVDRCEWINDNSITVPNDNQWHLVEIQFVVDTEYTDNKIYVQPGRGEAIATTFYVKYVQLEQKPFATSFVNGTRNYGQLKMPIAKTENMVIVGWFKPTGVYDGTSDSGEEARIINFEPVYNGDSLRLMYQKGTSSSGQPLYTFAIRTTVSGSGAKTWSVKTYQPEQWYFFVFILDNGTYNAYIFDVDGSYEIITHTVDMSSLEADHFLIGCRPNTESGTANGLISNLFIGKYRDDQNNIIWTDEYIQEIYNARKPFSVPPRLPIL